MNQTGGGPLGGRARDMAQIVKPLRGTGNRSNSAVSFGESSCSRRHSDVQLTRIAQGWANGMCWGVDWTLRADGDERPRGTCPCDCIDRPWCHGSRRSRG